MPINGIISRSSLVELKAAIAVAESCSFRVGADTLGMSPTAISSTIRSLENRLGIRLFNRTTRSVSLTSAGKELIGRIVPLLAEIERALEAAGSQAGHPSGVLRINSSVTAAHAITGILQDFMERCPDVKIELTTETGLIDIVLDGYDAGIRLRDSVPADMVAVPFQFGLDFCVVGSPSYLAERTLPKVPADLMTHKCIRSKHKNGGQYRWEFECSGEVATLEVPGQLLLDDQSLILKAAIDGMGLAYVARSVAGEAVKAGELISLLEEWMPRSSPLCLYYPHNRNTSASLRALIDLIRER